MKKIIISLSLMLCSFLLIACGEEMMPNQAVDDYLQKYVTLDDDVVDQINEYVDKEEMTDEQKSKYKQILRDQYSTLTYTIKNVKYDENDEDVAYVDVEINVRDLYKVQQTTLEYYENNKNEFNDKDGNYDISKYLDYKLEQMKEATETTTHNIVIKVVKNDKDWDVSQLSNDDLQKIHGIYEYGE